MSTAVLPVLPGLTYNVTREPVFSTTTQAAISGKETRIALQSYPRWKWTLIFSVLRSAAAYTEFQQLAGFFLARLGQLDTFLYQDADDNAVTGQQIGTGDGTTTTFQLIRSLGGFNEPILAPYTVSHVYNNGTDSGGWTVSNWGTSTPGLITYASAPAAGHAITADFSYYWPVRMSDDSLPFELFMSGMYSAKKFSFISVKN